MAVMLPGVRPSISFASLPTASIWSLTLLTATIDGSLRTMPVPRANTQVLAVPRSIARSWEKSDSAPSSIVGPLFPLQQKVSSRSLAMASGATTVPTLSHFGPRWNGRNLHEITRETSPARRPRVVAMTHAMPNPSSDAREQESGFRNQESGNQGWLVVSSVVGFLRPQVRREDPLPEPNAFR